MKANWSVPLAGVSALSLFLTASPPHATPVATARSTTCSKEEAVVFSCAVGSKVAALCAAPDGVGLRYLFGKPGFAELSLTNRGGPPDRMTYGALSYSGGGGDFVRVLSGRYSYVVYSAIGRGWEQEGVVVEKDGKRISARRCVGPALGPNGWARVYAAHLPKDAQGFDKPD
jgi:hypothetical protein